MFASYWLGWSSKHNHGGSTSFNRKIFKRWLDHYLTIKQWSNQSREMIREQSGFAWKQGTTSNPMFQKCFRKTLKYGPVDWEPRTRKSRPTIWRKFSQHLSCCINPIHYRFSFSQPYLAMKHLQKKQGVGVAKEPQRNIKILKLSV